MGLLTGSLATALAAVVTAIVVERYIHVGFFQLAFMRQSKLDVLDVQSPLHPHAFIIRLDGQDAPGGLVNVGGEIQVVCLLEQRQLIFLHHQRRVGEQKVGVGLEMHHSTVHQKVAIAVHEIGAGEAFSGILHLRIRESEPYFPHLIRRKKAVNHLDVRAKKSHIV